MGESVPNENENEHILGYFTVTKPRILHSATYNVYFTTRRIVFAKVGGVGPSTYTSSSGSLLTAVAYIATEGGREKKRDELNRKYDQMTPQEIADYGENVGVLLNDVESVTVHNKGVPQVIFKFRGKQKFDWEKIDFLLADPIDRNLRSAGQFLQRYLPDKLDNQLQNRKGWFAREIFEKG